MFKTKGAIALNLYFMDETQYILADSTQSMTILGRNRLDLRVSMKPFYCTDAIKTGCIQSGKRVSIRIKTEQWALSAVAFKIEGIVLDGVDNIGNQLMNEQSPLCLRSRANDCCKIQEQKIVPVNTGYKCTIDTANNITIAEKSVTGALFKLNFLEEKASNLELPSISLIVSHFSSWFTAIEC